MSEVAIIEGYYHFYLIYDVDIQIIDIDGVEKGLFPHGAIVLPGLHRIRISKTVVVPFASGDVFCWFDLEAEAGHRYEIKSLDVDEDSGDWVTRAGDHAGVVSVNDYAVNESLKVLELPAVCKRT